MYFKIIPTVFFLWGLFLRTAQAGSGSKQLSTVSWGPDQVHTFSLGFDFNIYHHWKNSTGHYWERLPPMVFSSQPEAVSWGPNRIDVFAKGLVNELSHNWWDGSSWHEWEDLGGLLASDISCVSLAPNNLDVFALGSDNIVFGRRWKLSAWEDWMRLGDIQAFSAPFAAHRGENLLDLLVVGVNSAPYYQVRNGNDWLGWEYQSGGVLSNNVRNG